MKSYPDRENSVSGVYLDTFVGEQKGKLEEVSYWSSGNYTYFKLKIGFFKNASISYDVGQPYVSYGMYKTEPQGVIIDTTWIRGKEVAEEFTTILVTKTKNTAGIALTDTLLISLPSQARSLFQTDTIHYQHVDYATVLQNTLLTSLMQEPTDLFSVCSTYTDIGSVEQQNRKDVNDEAMSTLFRWILILQVFISWIFFGVFISIPYNKFRYES